MTKRTDTLILGAYEIQNAFFNKYSLSIDHTCYLIPVIEYIYTHNRVIHLPQILLYQSDNPSRQNAHGASKQCLLIHFLLPFPRLANDCYI